MSWFGKIKVKKGLEFSSLKALGETLLAATAGTTDNIKVILRDSSNDILYATGTDVPADTTSGYAKGCLFIDTNVAAGTTGLYVNVGTNTSANFDAVSDA